MHNQASVDYAVESVRGVFAHSLRSVHPYVYLQPSRRFSVWGIGGFGEGEGRVSESGRDDSFGTSFRMVSAGSRAVISRRGSREFGIRADAFSVQLGADQPISGASHAASGEASRARTMLELVLDRQLTQSSSLSFKAEFGGRLDRGDAFEGFGTEAGVRLGLISARSGFDIALFGRSLVTHVSGNRDWGLGVQASWDPGRKDRGLRFTVAPTRGQDLAGRTTLWTSTSAARDTHARRYLPGSHEQNRLETGAAYGWDVLGRRGLVTAFSRVRLARVGRELRMGTEFVRLSRHAAALPLKIGFEVSRRGTAIRRFAMLARARRARSASGQWRAGALGLTRRLGCHCGSPGDRRSPRECGIGGGVWPSVRCTSTCCLTVT